MLGQSVTAEVENREVDEPFKRVVVVDGRFGLGVFAAQPILRGQAILKLAGPQITFEEAVRKGDRESYALQIDRELYIDPEAPGCLVNHSCEPNAGIKQSGDERVLVAIRDIREGEEVLYDYSTTMDEDYWELGHCCCGAATCRRTIRDFKYLPYEVRLRYLALGIVGDFIVATVR